jgi:hypothetical protein
MFHYGARLARLAAPLFVLLLSPLLVNMNMHEKSIGEVVVLVLRAL